MADVAKLCGVTAATVSRVLNDNKSNFSARKEVRKRIWAAARKLGYMPDLSARSLAMGNTRVIGLFASPQTHIAEGINEPMIEGIAEPLHAADYDVFFGLTPTHGKKNPLPIWRFDGAVLLQAPKIETVTELDLRRVPYVCVNERAGSAVAYVLADDQMGMKLAISHLTELGHRRFAYANARNHLHYSVKDRYQALLAAARAQTIQLVTGHDWAFESPVEFLRTTVLNESATAVITYDHQKAVAILGAAYEMGLRVPKDFSLICFNDVFPVALSYPPLTTIKVAGREMGRLGASLLLNHLDSPQPMSGKEIRVPEDLILRSSTSFLSSR